MTDILQYRDYVLRPTLTFIGMGGEAAEKLMLGTALQESNFMYLEQIGPGPARSLYQVEPKTHDSVWADFLVYRDVHRAKIRQLMAPWPINPKQQLYTNRAYACAIARLVYYRRPEALPSADDPRGIAAYYKKWYNTPGGKATTDQFLVKYHAEVAPLYA